MTTVRIVTIGAEATGQRIDNYLLTQFKRVPRSRVYRVLRKGEVRVNKKRVDADYRLQEGDVVRLPPIKDSEGPTVIVDPRKVAQTKQCILYEDEHLLVLNKPSGLAVHAGSGIESGLIELLRAREGQSGFLELVHRLDRETSGCLLLAKDRKTLLALHQLLREGQITKRYLALVVGCWEKSLRIDAPLRRTESKIGTSVCVAEDGSSAITDFKPLQHFQSWTLVQAEPLTGRTHQIRVHAAHAGHPIAGDDRYGDWSLNKQLKVQGLNRLFLHAVSISFYLDHLKKDFSFKADLDPILQRFIENLV